MSNHRKRDSLGGWREQGAMWFGSDEEILFGLS
ncbi:hypothetical protein NC652_002457 [Populus alba x Populus x berolinensis]|uniref:Uncharacterized protein n=1 Tax=Populus alba x Populus x berolinensis TaxID=444605 RepID=A0AAD6RPB8_9ROSI|nr:hypothetical protein NC652_002457 [Populus alba x Populus x berolinensis]KAJ7012497.1 hypothetical protein NC653_002525 [Populus alba x Populus x berolinensis]